MSTKTWGIHLFQKSIYTGLQAGSYYVERPYSPYLIFPPQSGSLSKEKDFPFIESKGGLAFLLHLYPDRPNEIQKSLYQRFGCPLVAPWDETVLDEYIHEDYSFRYGRRGHDFYDHHVIWTKVNDHPALLLLKDQGVFLFLGAPWLLDRGVVRHGPSGKAVTSFDLDLGQKGLNKRPFFGLFQFFRGLNWCDLTSMISLKGE